MSSNKKGGNLNLNYEQYCKFHAKCAGYINSVDSILNAADKNEWNYVHRRLPEIREKFIETIQGTIKKIYREQNPTKEVLSQKSVVDKGNTQQIFDSSLERKYYDFAQRAGRKDVIKNEKQFHLKSVDGKGEIFYTPDFFITNVKQAWNGQLTNLVLEVKGELNENYRKYDIAKMKTMARYLEQQYKNWKFLCIGPLPEKYSKFDSFLNEAEKIRVENKDQIFVLNADERSATTSIAYDEECGLCIYNDPSQIPDKAKEKTKELFDEVRKLKHKNSWLTFK